MKINGQKMSFGQLLTKIRQKSYNDIYMHINMRILTFLQNYFNTKSRFDIDFFVNTYINPPY